MLAGVGTRQFEFTTRRVREGVSRTCCADKYGYTAIWNARRGSRGERARSTWKENAAFVMLAGGGVRSDKVFQNAGGDFRRQARTVCVYFSLCRNAIDLSLALFPGQNGVVSQHDQVH